MAAYIESILIVDMERFEEMDYVEFTLKNKSKVKGVIERFDNGEVIMETANGYVSINPSEIEKYRWVKTDEIYD